MVRKTKSFVGSRQLFFLWAINTKLYRFAGWPNAFPQIRILADDLSMFPGNWLDDLARQQRTRTVTRTPTRRERPSPTVRKIQAWLIPYSAIHNVSIQRVRVKLFVFNGKICCWRDMWQLPSTAASLPSHWTVCTVNTGSQLDIRWQLIFLFLSVESKLFIYRYDSTVNTICKVLLAERRRRTDNLAATGDALSGRKETKRRYSSREKVQLAAGPGGGCGVWELPGEDL